MEWEQLQEWSELESEARAIINNLYDSDKSGEQCLLCIIIEPAFDNPINCRLVRKHTIQNNASYVAVYTSWKHLEDLEKFRTPTERLKYPEKLSPTIISIQIDLESIYVEQLMHQFENISIPSYVSNHSIGCDGVFYKLILGDDFLNASYQWWCEPPEKWQSLEKIVNDILDYIRNKIDRQSMIS
ncbi:MAG: hypothetical protein AAGA60_25750 [Cyanobacteria bacterium P01_E01_bin.42]